MLVTIFIQEVIQEESRSQRKVTFV